MAKKKGDLLLHPVRLRILTELGGKQLTSKQLARALPDIPQATLYRHIKTLFQGSILEVVKEEWVNGTTERTYGIVKGASNLSKMEVKDFSKEDHLQYFSTFVGSLLDSFSRYIQQSEPDKVGEEGLSYNRIVIYASEEEQETLRTGLQKLLMEAVQRQPSPERKRFTLASVVIPDERSE